MSYGGVENTPDELSDLKGAKITSIVIEPDGFGDEKITMKVTFRPGLVVNGSRTGTYEVWMDAEGNGPGFFAFVGE